MGWLAIVWLVLPSLGNRWIGQSSMLRFDPIVSTDYNCIFVEGHTRPSFAVPWLSRSTPADYLRIRYTPHAGHQPYGIMFIDPKTLAYEPHSGFSEKPTHLAGRLDSSSLIRDWMRSQAQSAQAASHDGDAQEIYAAITELARADLEHFTLPASIALTHYRIGHTSLTDHHRPSWPITLLILIPIWAGVFGRKTQPNTALEPTADSAFSSASRSTPGVGGGSAFGRSPKK